MNFNSYVVQSVLEIIKSNPGISYSEITTEVKTKKLKTNRALLNILINDLIVTNQVTRTNTSPKRYYLK